MISAETACRGKKKKIAKFLIEDFYMPLYLPLYSLSCLQELETRRGEVASLKEQLARTILDKDKLAKVAQERDDLQQRLEQSLASLKEAEEAERTRVEAERTRVEAERGRAEVERMRDKVEEDLRRQVASLSQKLDSTLQGTNRNINKIYSGNF